MAIGLPTHLRPRHAASSFTRAVHAVALLCLLVEAWTILTLQASYPEFVVWPALIALVPIAAALYVLDRIATAPFAILYLVVGGVCAYWFALIVFSAYPDAPPSDTFALSVLRVALALAGSAGALPWSGLLWCVGGMTVAEIAITAAAVQTGADLSFDVGVIVVLAVMGMVFLGAFRIQRSVRRTQPRLHRAANEETLAATRSGIEARAVAVMHDTVLGHLAAISKGPPGPLRSDLREQIARDLEVLAGKDWLAEPVDAEAEGLAEASAQWQRGPLLEVVREVRALGLRVEISGDMGVIGRLDARRAEALALATKQCLVNVLHHSGTDHAELVLYGGPNDIGVMIVDEGRGFSERDTGPDRLGLRQSVRQRMAAVDGVVQVWSAPGRGTSVSIRVPTTDSAPERAL